MGTQPYSGRANGHKEIVRYRLAANANVNAVNNFGMTALMSSAEEGSPKIISLLLVKSAEKYAAAHGKSASDVAREIGNTEALAVLRGEARPESFPRDFQISNNLQPRDVRRTLLDSFILRDAFLLESLTQPVA
jgi:hypothetical protein